MSYCWVAVWFQNTGNVDVSGITCDFRVRQPKSQIIQLTKSTVQEYDAIDSVQKPSSELQAYVVIVISFFPHLPDTTYSLQWWIGWCRYHGMVWSNIVLAKSPNTRSSAVAERPHDASCLSVVPSIIQYLEHSLLLLVTGTSAADLPMRTIKFCSLCQSFLL